MSERGHFANPTFMWGHLKCELSLWKKLGALGWGGSFCEGGTVAGWGQLPDSLGKVGGREAMGMKRKAQGNRAKERSKGRCWPQRVALL